MSEKKTQDDVIARGLICILSGESRLSFPFYSIVLAAGVAINAGLGWGLVTLGVIGIGNKIANSTFFQDPYP